MVGGACNTSPTNTNGTNYAWASDALEGVADEVHITGRQGRRSGRTRHQQRYRAEAEARASHRKRGYGLRRSRLEGDDGHRIWDGWAAFSDHPDAYTPLLYGNDPSNPRGTGEEPVGSRRRDRHRFTGDLSSAAIPQWSTSASRSVGGR